MSVDSFALGKQQILCWSVRVNGRPPTSTTPMLDDLLDGGEEGSIWDKRERLFCFVPNSVFFFFREERRKKIAADCRVLYSAWDEKLLNIIGRHPTPFSTTPHLLLPPTVTFDGCKWPYISTPTPINESVLCMRTRLDFTTWEGAFFYFIFCVSVLGIY